MEYISKIVKLIEKVVENGQHQAVEKKRRMKRLVEVEKGDLDWMIGGVVVEYIYTSPVALYGAGSGCRHHLHGNMLCFNR